MKELKKRIVLFIVTVVGFAFSINAQAQQVKYCATDEKMREMYKEHPGLLKEQQRLEKLYNNIENNFKISAGVVYVIPVVVHVVHNNGPENISDAQIRDGIRILNEDFRKLNFDTSNIVAAFMSIAADSEIEFHLAQKDPSGNCTNGIVRLQTFMTNDPNGIYEQNIKADRWPVDKYLNVWTAADIGGAAGYAYLPPANSSVDGIMILHDYFGSIGTASIGDGRALTHETGHYLGLSHTWGWGTNGDSGNCSADDGVSDTPNTIGHFGCNLTAVSCSSLDNIQNYMEYTSCTRMFTEGQKTRMRIRLTNSFYGRTNLWTTSNLIATGTGGNDILCAADFILDNTILCAGETVNFIDVSYNGQTTWNWSFPGGIPSTSTDVNPVITYNTPGVYDVSLSVSNGTNSVSTTKIAYVNVMIPQTVPYLEDFESVSIPGSEWEIINNDNGNTWALTTAASYSGNESLKMNNFSGNTIGETDEAINSIIDLSVMDTAQFTFKVAYAQKNSSTNDVLWIYVSNDCGNSWITFTVITGVNLSSVGYQTSEFIPADTSEWKEISINIPSTYLTANFRFKFKFICNEGNNLYIDDINIDGVFKPIPILVSPPNYSTGQPIDVTLDWNDVLGSDYYQYEIDTTILFSSSLSTSDTISYSEYLLTNLEYETTYYWRARTIMGIDTSDWSPVWRFTTFSNVPFLVSPPDYSTNQSINLILDWNDVLGSDYYQYEIDTAILFSSSLLISDTISYSEYLLTNLEYEMTYYWRVSTVTGIDTSDWSSVWRFTTLAPVGIDDDLTSNVNLLIFPNPVVNYSVISFNLHKSQHVTLKVYDILGREILNLIDEKLNAGTYQYETKGVENTGIYLVKLVAGDQEFTRKMIIK